MSESMPFANILVEGVPENEFPPAMVRKIATTDSQRNVVATSTVSIGSVSFSLPVNSEEDGGGKIVKQSSKVSVKRSAAVLQVPESEIFKNNNEEEEEYKSDKDLDQKQVHVASESKTKGDDDTVKRSTKANGSNVLSTGSSSNENRFAREISETTSFKMKAMIWCLLAAASNSLLLAATVLMKDGLEIAISAESLYHVVGVIFEILLLIANILTLQALDSGAAAFFGVQMATRSGSMALIGFLQASPLSKPGFANDLSLNSKVRKILSRMAIVWVVIELAKIATPFSATSVYPKERRVDAGSVHCIVFDQKGEPFDRKWPNLDLETGVSELVFGTSLGRLRSEELVNETMLIMSPQLDGVIGNGDTLVGPGFSMNITTKCQCAKSNTIDTLQSLGVPSEHLNDFTGNISALFPNRAMINYIQKNPDGISMTITTALTGFYLCGGLQTTSFPVCFTTMSNHKRVVAVMEYMTDGTPASIAQKEVQLRSYVSDADFDWAHQAMTFLVGSGVRAYELPSTVPAMLHPMIYWTSTDLLSVDPTLLEAGVETTFAIIMRAAIQRGYSTYGSSCVKNVVDPASSKVYIQGYGYSITMVALILQVSATGMAILSFGPWLASSVPAGPAIRALLENAYFTSLLADSNLGDSLKGLSNAPSHAIWQMLDREVRIGEAIGTQDDEIGHITMDKTKFVTPLINGRRYS